MPHHSRTRCPRPSTSPSSSPSEASVSVRLGSERNPWPARFIDDDDEDEQEGEGSGSQYSWSMSQEERFSTPPMHGEGGGRSVGFHGEGEEVVDGLGVNGGERGGNWGSVGDIGELEGYTSSISDDEEEHAGYPTRSPQRADAIFTLVNTPIEQGHAYSRIHFTGSSFCASDSYDEDDDNDDETSHQRHRTARNWPTAEERARARLQRLGGILRSEAQRGDVGRGSKRVSFLDGMGNGGERGGGQDEEENFAGSSGTGIRDVFSQESGRRHNGGHRIHLYGNDVDNRIHAGAAFGDHISNPTSSSSHSPTHDTKKTILFSFPRIDSRSCTPLNPTTNSASRDLAIRDIATKLGTTTHALTEDRMTGSARWNDGSVRRRNDFEESARKERHFPLWSQSQSMAQAEGPRAGGDMIKRKQLGSGSLRGEYVKERGSGSAGSVSDRQARMQFSSESSTPPPSSAGAQDAVMKFDRARKSLRQATRDTIAMSKVTETTTEAVDDIQVAQGRSTTATAGKTTHPPSREHHPQVPINQGARRSTSTSTSAQTATLQRHEHEHHAPALHDKSMQSPLPHVPSRLLGKRRGDDYIEAVLRAHAAIVTHALMVRITNVEPRLMQPWAESLWEYGDYVLETSTRGTSGDGIENDSDDDAEEEEFPLRLSERPPTPWPYRRPRNHRPASPGHQPVELEGEPAQASPQINIPYPRWSRMCVLPKFSDALATHEYWDAENDALRRHSSVRRRRPVRVPRGGSPCSSCTTLVETLSANSKSFEKLMCEQPRGQKLFCCIPLPGRERKTKEQGSHSASRRRIAEEMSIYPTYRGSSPGSKTLRSRSKAEPRKLMKSPRNMGHRGGRDEAMRLDRLQVPRVTFRGRQENEQEWTGLPMMGIAMKPLCDGKGRRISSSLNS